jgi:site-specific recombinase XerD
LLDRPAGDTIAKLHDGAILSVGSQVGLRRAEITALTVADLHQNRDYDSLKVMRKGGIETRWRSIRILRHGYALSRRRRPRGRHRRAAVPAVDS